MSPPDTPPGTRGRNTRLAALWMAGWLTLMLIMPVSGRELAKELDLIQVVFVRSALGLLLLLPLVYRSGGLATMVTSRPGLHIARNVVHYLAQYGWLVAVTMIPLAQVVALEFTMPIWTALLAITLLGERMTSGRLTAIVLGLIGVLVIVRPGVDAANPGQLIALATAVGFAVSVTMVKSLTRSDSALRIMFWMVIIQGLIGLLPAIAVWRWPSAASWGWLVVIAFVGTFSHYCLANALRHADAMVVVPMDFLRVPLTALVGWLIYTESFDLVSAVGAALILLGNLFNLRAPAARPAR